MKVFKRDQSDKEKKRSGKARYARAKGLAFQSSIAMQLQEALPDYLAVVGKQAGKGGKGNPDVKLSGPDLIFHIEAKTGKNISIDAAYEQAAYDARGTDIPVVWRHRTDGRTLVCLDPNDFIACLQTREAGQGTVILKVPNGVPYKVEEY